MVTQRSEYNFSGAGRQLVAIESENPFQARNKGVIYCLSSVFYVGLDVFGSKVVTTPNVVEIEDIRMACEQRAKLGVSNESCHKLPGCYLNAQKIMLYAHLHSQSVEK